MQDYDSKMGDAWHVCMSKAFSISQPYFCAVSQGKGAQFEEGVGVAKNKVVRGRRQEKVSSTVENPAGMLHAFLATHIM